MEESSVFIINTRFKIETGRSEVTDQETGQKNRLEPRLMKLLCILVAHRGEIVKRDFIIKEIWDDYPGASEGLNQAISFLRKLLADEKKSIIQTQPKAGYIFQAIISEQNESVYRHRKNYKYAVIIASALLLLFFFMLGKHFIRNDNLRPNDQTNEKRDVEISRIDSIQQAEKKRYFKDTLGSAASGDTIHNTDTLRR